MPKFHPTPLIQDCWSSIGNITFFHRNGQCYYKRKPYTHYQGTAAQLDQAQLHHISSYNLFVSAYHGFAQLGHEHVPEPPPFPQFPTSALELLQITHSSGVATLRCRLSLTDTVHPERWHVSARIQLAPPGVGYNPGKMRNYMGLRNQVNEIVFNVPSPDIEGFHVYFRYRLIDEKTGYRTNTYQAT